MFESKNRKSSYQNEKVEIRIAEAYMQIDPSQHTHTKVAELTQNLLLPFRVMNSLIEEDNYHHKL